MSETAVSISINGEPVEATPNQLLIEACSDAGVYVPYFCYHPRMKPVGMCRMCLVEVDTGRGPALMTSCTLPVAENMEVFTKSDAVKKAQDGILEFLLLNHPLDCPVCDKGGECPLQDQTMAFGPGESRFVENKRHFEKPIPISSQVFLDRERCILCDRCTRFADEVAGEALISFQGRGQHMEVNTFPEIEFDSYFSGNTVQICPVGALTAKSYRFKARPWDLVETVSTYPNPMGDRITLQASNNQLIRILGVDSDAVNWGWLTDKDRFGFEAVASPNRITTPLIKKVGQLVEVTWQEAISTAAEFIKSSLKADGPNSIAVIGGASLPAEDQFVWTRLTKGVIGTDNVDALVGEQLLPEIIAGVSRPTLDEALSPGSLVLFMGSDIKEELGTLYLRLRHAILNDGVSLIELTPTETSLTELAIHTQRIFPGEINEVVQDILETGNTEYKEIAKAIATAAKQKNLTIIFGASSLAESPQLTGVAVSALYEAFGAGVCFLPLLREGNIFGAVDMGLVPGVLPGPTSLDEGEQRFLQAWGRVPIERGKDTAEILECVRVRDITTLILLGEDPLSTFPDAELLDKAMAASPNIIALEKFNSPNIANHASVVFPVPALGEREGSHINIEGRISPLNRIISPNFATRCEWEIGVELAAQLPTRHQLEVTNLESIWTQISDLCPQYKSLSFAQIQNSVDGILPISPQSRSDSMGSLNDGITGIAKDNYAHRLVVQRPMYDGNCWQRQCSSFKTFLPEPEVIYMNPEEFPKLGISSGSSVEVSRIVDGQTIKKLILVAKADPTLPLQVAAMKFSPTATQLIDSKLATNDVLIQGLSTSSVDPFAN